MSGWFVISEALCIYSWGSLTVEPVTLIMDKVIEY